MPMYWLFLSSTATPTPTEHDATRMNGCSRGRALLEDPQNSHAF
jgi:hypothetical protein